MGEFTSTLAMFAYASPIITIVGAIGTIVSVAKIVNWRLANIEHLLSNGNGLLQRQEKSERWQSRMEALCEERHRKDD